MADASVMPRIITGPTNAPTHMIAGRAAKLRCGAADEGRRAGRKADSDAALAETVTKYASDSAFNIAYILAWRNERDCAFEWLDKAVTQEDPGLSEIAYNPLFANLHDDPRWLPFLRKIGKAPEQLAAIKFDVKVPN